MAACARRDVIDPTVPGVYHCWNRCVRRAFLCGRDEHSGKDYNYRRQWLEDREILLARFFAVEVGWHGEMENHAHLILRNRPDVVQTWSDYEVVRRCLIINRLTRSYDDTYKEPTDEEIQVVLADAEKTAFYREKISSISAFMGSLCENIALRCNREDEVTGKFWESRFGCRRLVDEAAILVCGIYIDLNQIRAGEVSTPEESTHTSAYNRICGMFAEGEVAVEGTVAAPASTERQGEEAPEPTMPPDGWLCELTLEEGPDVDIRKGLTSSTPWRLTDKGMLPISLTDYLELLDWTGRQQRADKVGCIPDHLAPILERLHICGEQWVETVTHFQEWFGRAVGRLENVVQLLVRAGRKWIRGVRQCATSFT